MSYLSLATREVKASFGSKPDAVEQPRKKRKRRSTTARGQQLQQHAKRILESRGYAVAVAGNVIAWTPPPVRRPITRQHDLFGCIDLIAKKRDHVTLFVQVTDKGHRRAREHKCTPFARDYTSNDTDSVQVWGFVSGHRSKGGQRFLVREWNGAGEWADCDDEICLPATARSSKA
jgi:hypothetical protein